MMPKYQFENQYVIHNCFECPFGLRPVKNIVRCWHTLNEYDDPKERPDDCPLQEVK